MAVAVITERSARPGTRRTVREEVRQRPQAVRARDARGHRLANPDTLTYVPEYNLIMRTDAPRTTRCRSCRVPGPATSPRTSWSSARACSTPRVPATCSPRRRWTTSTRRPRSSRTPKGVLLLVNNYTGDRMAFDMGKEMAESEGVRTEILMINDDVAVKDSTYTIGRRGVAGNFFVIKAVGAAAERGDELEEVRADRQEGQRRHPHDGRRADRLHPTRQGLAAVRARRDEMEVGRRHPRRAGPRAPHAGRRGRDRRRAARRRRPTCRTPPATASR